MPVNKRRDRLQSLHAMEPAMERNEGPVQEATQVNIKTSCREKKATSKGYTLDESIYMNF